MALVNEHFLKLPGSYLFSDIAKKVNTFRITHPKQEVIRLGIGDVTRPLPPVCIEAMHKAVEEMADTRTFRGYGPEQGYDFLIEAIIKHDYLPRGIHFGPTEIFVNDGAKSDTGNIGDILRHDNSVGVTDPIYPVYIDSNVMCGRAGVLEENGQWSNVTYMPCTAENDFIPEIPDKRIDIVYLCYPNNPTGTTLTKPELKKWVDYALANNAVIIFDAAYEAFITEADLPRSIYLVEGAKKCAIEICSLSKTAGFTGTRCGYTIVPDELIQKDSKGSDVKIADLWNRRQGSKFNGVSYPVQRAAEAVFTPEGQKQTKATIAYYQENARIIAKTCDELGIKYTGGINSPYIWLKSPNGMGSWEFFDYLLNEIQVVGTPGAGFGANGDGWFRLTAFSTHELTAEAMERFKTLFKK